MLLLMASLIFPKIAGATVCKTRVVHSICGSGEVEIKFNLDRREFEMNDGDVICWSDPLLVVTGQMTEEKPQYPYYLVGTYSLVSTHPNQPDTELGTLLYDPKDQVARLEISSDRLTAKRSYDLHCE
jgi:hypothetical protein